MEQQLRNNRRSYRDRLYNLFTAYTNYTEFASKAWFPNDGGNYDSVESVHDQIHGLVGNGGHMSYVSDSDVDGFSEFLTDIVVRSTTRPLIPSSICIIRECDPYISQTATNDH